MSASAARLYRGKLQRLSDHLGGQSEVARALDVDRSRVSRWLRSSGPDPENLAKLDALEFVVARLQQVFPPDVARKWLTGVNAHLGNRRPIDLVAVNRIAEVVAAIEQDAEGTYA